MPAGFLRLDGTTTPKEIQKRLSREAIQLHPDLNPNLSEVEASMTRLRHAYRLLTAYAESQFKNWVGALLVKSGSH